MGAKLGEGSFATVHKGKHLATGKGETVLESDGLNEGNALTHLV